MVRNAQYQEIPAYRRCEARLDAPTLLAPVVRRRWRSPGEARLPSAEAARLTTSGRECPPMTMGRATDPPRPVTQTVT